MRQASLAGQPLADASGMVTDLATFMHDLYTTRSAVLTEDDQLMTVLDGWAAGQPFWLIQVENCDPIWVYEWYGGLAYACHIVSDGFLFNRNPAIDDQLLDECGLQEVPGGWHSRVLDGHVYYIRGQR